VGNEWNSVHKDSAASRGPSIKVALAFPDLYEIGMSHLGMNILYHLLNEQEDVIAERVYCPWIDMEEKMRQNKISIFSIESHTPLKEFDIVGFSLQYEMCYTNVLTMLDLAGIPLFASQRDETYPLIIAGGACGFNPEPLSEFIDMFVVGEAEEAIIEIVKKVQKFKGLRVKRQELLKEMTGIEGVYVPSLYEIHYNPDGTVHSIKPVYDGIPPEVKKRIVENIDSVFYPVKPVVPYQAIIHDRAVVEILRGCTQGCRFCQAGMISRPVRMKSLNRLKEISGKIIENTGWEEISLLALNACDYPEIEGIVRSIIEKYGRRGVRISLPSVRPQDFSLHLACALSLDSRAKPTLTFAPEAGTQRLRNIINKGLDEDEIMANIKNAYKAGWDSCKLYFMIGLPGETEEDIRGIIEFTKKLEAEGKRINPKASVHASISSFVPKPHTPFQWEPQEKIEVLHEKQKKIINSLKKIEIRWHRPEMSFLEGVFARGDRNLGRVILHAWRNGARFDSWEETFKFSIWENAFREYGIDPSFYLYRKRDYNEIFPWDHIDTGVKKEFLINENKKSKAGIITPNCIFEGCQGCGACAKFGTHSPKIKVNTEKYSPSFLKFDLPSEAKQRIRITFSKREKLKYISHLDLHRTIVRALRRAEIPFTFSSGFHPQPRVILGLPLSVGMVSDAELCDVFLYERVEPGEFIRRLSAQLPEGLVLKNIEEIFLPAPPLPSIIKAARYNVDLRLATEGMENTILAEKIEAFLQQDKIVVRRKARGTSKMLNIRPMIEDIEYTNPDSSGHLALKISMKVSNESNARVDEVIQALFGSEAKILRVERKELLCG